MYSLSESETDNIERSDPKMSDSHAISVSVSIPYAFTDGVAC